MHSSGGQRNRSLRVTLLIALGVLLIFAGFLWLRPGAGKFTPQPVNNFRNQSKLSKNQEIASQPSKPVPVSNPVKKFNQMSILEYRARMAEFDKLDLESLFRLWVESYSLRHDSSEQNGIGHIIARRLQGGQRATALYAEFDNFLASPANPSWQKTELYSLLGQIRTNEALEILINAATSAPTSESRRFIAEQIKSFAAIGDGKFHEELSPQLEAIWTQTRVTELLGATAFTIAELGAPHGVSIIFEAAMSNDANDAHTIAAREALGYLMNPDAVPTLVSSLENTSDIKRSQLAGEALVTIGDKVAGEALLNWARNSDDNAAGLISDLVARSNTNQMLQIWKSALSPAISFKSEKNRESVRTGLEQFYAVHKIGRP